MNVREVKSFLATLQFEAVYLVAEKGEETFAQLLDPFREAARKKIRFAWTKEMDQNFTELKEGCAVTKSWCPRRWDGLREWTVT